MPRGIASHGRGRNPLASRRVDRSHAWIDPILVAGPWVLAAVGAVTVVRGAVRALR